MDGIEVETEVVIDWKKLGEAMAHSDSVNQAAFLNGFSSAIYKTSNPCLQVAYISDELNQSSVDLFKDIIGFKETD
jgi:hypothetical protein